MLNSQWLIEVTGLVFLYPFAHPWPSKWNTKICEALKMRITSVFKWKFIFFLSNASNNWFDFRFSYIFCYVFLSEGLCVEKGFPLISFLSFKSIYTRNSWMNAKKPFLILCRKEWKENYEEIHRKTNGFSISLLFFLQLLTFSLFDAKLLQTIYWIFFLRFFIKDYYFDV